MINSYTSWQPLRECLVGGVYPPDYFDHVENAQVRAQLAQILAETAEDLDLLQRTIEAYGARVHRPRLAPKQVFQSSQQHGTVPIPPLTPRDWQITLGQRLLRINPVGEFMYISKQLYPDATVDPHANGYDRLHVLNGANASCIVRVGRDVFFDNSDYLRPEQTQWIRDHVLGTEYRIHEAVTDGHGDAVFAILKPGVIVSSKHDVNLNFERDFPGWEVLRVMDSSIDAAIRVGQFKQENFNGRWYVQGAQPDPAFAAYVDTYLRDWVGYVAETVFDVNCLVLDESNVIFSAYNQPVFDFCRRHHIEPHIVPLRHSYFWDGGISCCTQDLERAGGLETYL